MDSMRGQEPDNMPLNDDDSGESTASRALPLPQFLPARMGTRLFSIGALVERIVAEFYAEYDENAPALREANTAAKRLSLLLEVTNYVIAVDSVNIRPEEKARLIERAYSELFGYGPLDALFADPHVTTLSIKGARQIAVRYGHGDLVPLGQIFDDEEHLERMMRRLLLDAGASWCDENAISEIGLAVGARNACINLTAPPFATEINADIRVHPPTALTLDDLAAAGMVNAETHGLLRKIIASPYGFTIVGESESGKTTLLNAIAPLIPHTQSVIAVSRAPEMRLPDDIVTLPARWADDDHPAIPFGDQIANALAMMPTCVLMDEVRADAPGTIAPLLMLDPAPRQIWTVRGAPDSKRLQSALGMLARRAAPGQGETLVHALYERLPYVISVARIRDRLQIFSIAEWQSRVDTDYPDYVMLMRYEDGEARPTGNTPARWLD